MEEGATVAVTGRSAASLEAARKELGGDALAIESDAGDSDAQPALADAIQQAMGGLDVLFVNAGIAELRPLGNWDSASYDRVFATNLKGPYFLIQALLPVFARPASIVLNGSVNAHIGMAGTTVYGATKAALISLARTISGELVTRGIRVNTVSPGPITTPFYGKLGFSAEDLKAVSASIQGQVPMGRFGTTTEIADAVVFLASDESAYMIGGELMIDGGMGTL